MVTAHADRGNVLDARAAGGDGIRRQAGVAADSCPTAAPVPGLNPPLHRNAELFRPAPKRFDGIDASYRLVQRPPRRVLDPPGAAIGSATTPVLSSGTCGTVAEWRGLVGSGCEARMMADRHAGFWPAARDDTWARAVRHGSWLETVDIEAASRARLSVDGAAMRVWSDERCGRAGLGRAPGDALSLGNAGGAARASRCERRPGNGRARSCVRSSGGGPTRRRGPGEARTLAAVPRASCRPGHTVGRIIAHLVTRAVVEPVPIARSGAKAARRTARRHWARRLPKSPKPDEPGGIAQIDTVYVRLAPVSRVKHSAAYDPVARWTGRGRRAPGHRAATTAFLGEVVAETALAREGDPGRWRSAVQGRIRDRLSRKGQHSLRTPAQTARSSTAPSKAATALWRYEVHAVHDLPTRIDELAPFVDACQHSYNRHRPHAAVGGRTHPATTKNVPSEPHSLICTEPGPWSCEQSDRGYLVSHDQRAPTSRRCPSRLRCRNWKRS